MAIKDRKRQFQYKEGILSYVLNEFERRKRERAPYELQWALNLNFVQGNQYCQIDEVTNRIEYPESPLKHRFVANQIAPILEARRAALGRVRVTLKARPTSGSARDAATAKTTTAVLKSAHYDVGYLDKVDTATNWSETLGTVFYKNVWNPSKGRTLALRRELTEDGERLLPVKEGDLDVIVVPPFEIFPDTANVEDIDKCRSIIHGRVLPVDEIRYLFGVDVEGREVDVWSISNSNLGIGGLGYSDIFKNTTRTKKRDSEVVLEYYELPSVEFPNGLYIVVVGKKHLIHFGDLPYINGDKGERIFPFVRQVCQMRAGCLWGISLVERLIPIQREYNAVWNKIAEHLSLVAVGVLDVEEGTLTEETEKQLESRGWYPGMVLKRVGGTRPASFVHPAQLPADSYSILARLEREFMLASGVSVIARMSGVPAGVESGRAIEVLQEQDTARLSLAAEHIRSAALKNGQQWVRLYKQFAEFNRVLRMTDENGDVLVREWNKSDLTTDDIVLESESALKESPAQRESKVMELLSTGVLTEGRLSDKDRNQVMRLLQLGDWEHSTSSEEMHAQRAQREQQELEQDGTPPHVREYDNHEIHIAEHTKYRLTADYERLIRENPKMALIMDRHVYMHKMAPMMEAVKAKGQLLRANPSMALAEQAQVTEAQMRINNARNMEVENNASTPIPTAVG